MVVILAQERTYQNNLGFNLIIAYGKKPSLILLNAAIKTSFYLINLLFPKWNHIGGKMHHLPNLVLLKSQELT